MDKIIVSLTLIEFIIKNNCYDLDPKWINQEEIINYIYKSVKKELLLDDLYNYIADHCASKASYHPHYNNLASRICMSNLHRKTSPNFKETIDKLYCNVDKNGIKSKFISDDIYRIISENHEKIQSKLDFDRDFNLDYFSIRTLERSYLFRIHYVINNNNIVKEDKVIERPQHLFMRVALEVHRDDLEKAFETYDYISNKYFTFATPTLFNAATIRPQMSSCFLLPMYDNIDGIFRDTISDIACISKWSGGIGVSLSDIRSRGSLIRKTNGESNGIIPLCQVLNMVAKYINQGGKRNGSITVYLEPWHSEIYDFCELRKNNKNEENKARDLFMALWIPDLFMKRVKERGKWSLMCPDECKDLTSTYGKEFEDLYIKYEKEKKYKKQVDALNLWFHILECQIETGMPFMLYKDHANRKSNQKNLGTIKCSNLCTEIIQYTDNENIAVCNLSSICLPKYIEVRDNKKIFNFDKLLQVCKIVVENLDLIIDRNFYPVKKAEFSNSMHRPIGVGVQGLADVYNIMKYPFGSKEAQKLNKEIFETIYFGCLTASNKLAKKKGSYSSFKNSPASKGILQFHLWNLNESDLSGRYDWKTLIEDIKRNGLRNSLTTTVMPTASTAQIMGNSEAIEPYLSNVFTRSTLSGEFTVINENLIYDLINLNLWSSDMRKKIIVMNGSIADINEIPDNIKEIYKTAFEIKLKDIITQAVQRGPFIDQSQSLNLFLAASNFDILSSAHFFGWENGLKTGMYYLRSCPSINPIQYGIEATEIKKIKNNIKKNNEPLPTVCPLRRPNMKVSECTSCSA